MADHAGELQAALGLAGAVVVAAAERRIALDQLAADQVPADARDRHRGGGRHADQRSDALGVERRPHQDLHAAERAADHRLPARDPEVIGDPALRLDHVLDGDPRVARAVRLAGLGVDGGRPGGAPRRAREVHAHHEVIGQVDALAVADQAVPPARRPDRSGAYLPGGVRPRRQRVADQDRVAAIRGEPSEGLVDDRERRDPLAVLELEAVRQLAAAWAGRRRTSTRAAAGSGRRFVAAGWRPFPESVITDPGSHVERFSRRRDRRRRARAGSRCRSPAGARWPAARGGGSPARRRTPARSAGAR